LAGGEEEGRGGKEMLTGASSWQYLHQGAKNSTRTFLEPSTTESKLSGVRTCTLDPRHTARRAKRATRNSERISDLLCMMGRRREDRNLVGTYVK
jgi:hypothetical protein